MLDKVSGLALNSMPAENLYIYCAVNLACYNHFKSLVFTLLSFYHNTHNYIGMKTVHSQKSGDMYMHEK